MCLKAPYPCHKDAICSKTGPAKFACKCRPGFDGDGKTACVPHDNCVSNPCPPHSACEVTGPGKNKCTPDKGYAFTADAKATIEIDNCKAAKGPCSPFATCEKKGPGTHQCTCIAGYHGDGVACIPVDNCKTGPCDPKATCKPIGPGKHMCKCLNGFSGDGSKGKCQEINLCSTKNPCHANADCTKTGPGRASCLCRKGYHGNGMQCKEVDNCKLRPFPCSVNADCTPTGPAIHKCECKPGYVGDGVTCRYDPTQIDMYDTNHNERMGRIKELMPKVTRVIFDGHDRIQDADLEHIHSDLNTVDQHVDRLTNIAESTTSDLSKTAKAMKAIRENTIPRQTLADGPVPNTGGLPNIDDATALPVIGDLAKERLRPRDAGLSRIAAT